MNFITHRICYSQVSIFKESPFLSPFQLPPLPNLNSALFQFVGFWQTYRSNWLNNNNWKVKVLATQLCPILCNPMDYRLPGSDIHGILQARVLERVAIPFSSRMSQPRDWTQVSCISGRFFAIWATREAQIVSNKWRNAILSIQMGIPHPGISHVWQVLGKEVRSSLLWLRGN